mmetsp:Transcript_10032/g.32903  ORF Transcript_10032/g.32903 Transcript_10032/m.32903 type:complete len:245 (+) Transcript_10032:495-1229(+)
MFFLLLWPPSLLAGAERDSHDGRGSVHVAPLSRPNLDNAALAVIAHLRRPRGLHPRLDPARVVPLAVHVHLRNAARDGHEREPVLARVGGEGLRERRRRREVGGDGAGVRASEPPHRVNLELSVRVVEALGSAHRGCDIVVRFVFPPSPAPEVALHLRQELVNHRRRFWLESREKPAHFGDEDGRVHGSRARAPARELVAIVRFADTDGPERRARPRDGVAVDVVAEYAARRLCGAAGWGGEPG